MDPKLELNHRCPALNFSNSTKAWTFSYLLPQGAAGLRKQSIALCHQVTTLDRSKFIQRIGELNPSELNLVEDGLKASLDLL